MQAHLDDARAAIADVRRGLAAASFWQILIAIAGVTAVIGGALAQLISINYLIIKGFPAEVAGWPVGGPYTVLLLSSLFALIVYLIVFCCWLIRYRPDVKQLFRSLPPGAYGLMTLAGFLNVTNGIAMIFAVKFLSETLQAILISAALPFTVVFARLFRVNRASYLHPIAVTSVILAVIGVAVGTVAVETGGQSTESNSGKSAAFVVIYLVGVVAMSLITVVAARFFLNYVQPELLHNGGSEGMLDDDRTEMTSVDLTPQLLQDEGICADTHFRAKLENGTALLLYLLFGTIAQCIFAVAAMPIDFADYIGNSPGNASASVHAISSGLDCVFNQLDGCTSAGGYFLVFVIGFSLNKAGTVLCAETISAPVSTLINLLVSPIGALIVSTISDLNPEGASGGWDG